ncbi:MAG: hypothetical protein KGI29_04730 [Pseudomonadota bacterium]|nr:hypothetical protein [Pseudomonadota bacterium]MDE3038673.1 hypothetical protein [Pseudomonadota bacterium]
MAHAPTRINLGSGKDFRTEYLNIDISGEWSPDIIADIGKLLPPSQTFTTRRFGEVEIAHDRFDEIIANDVLEHIPDLVCAMTNGLALLREGGMFNIIVPYDLSYGAWQDPTHLRAFNERSWLYYTDWFWYLNWQTHRFVVKLLEFNPSALGVEMTKAGQKIDLVLRTPRAVDSMKVALEKIALSEKDKETLRSFRAARNSN